MTYLKMQMLNRIARNIFAVGYNENDELIHPDKIHVLIDEKNEDMNLAIEGPEGELKIIVDDKKNFFTVPFPLGILITDIAEIKFDDIEKRVDLMRILSDALIEIEMAS